MTEPVPGLSLSPLEILTVLGAAAVVLARWLPSRARRPVLLCGIAVVAVTGIALAVLGLRWQLIPLLAGVAIVLTWKSIAALRSGRPRRRMKRWLAVPGTLACLALVAATPVAAWAMPFPVYPEPTGPHAVGAIAVQWTDEDRPEPFTEAPEDHRKIAVQLWYPAEKTDAERAFGGRETLEESQEVTKASADFFGIPSLLIDQSAEARSHAVFDAPVAAGGERYPVIVFSPGLTGTRTTNTVLAEEWASRGYVVASIDHTFDAALTVIDGEPVHSENSIAGLTEAEIEQETRDNLAVRTADLSFVLSQLESLDREEGPLKGRLDTERAAVAGHSRGAAAALMTAAADPRFAAVVHLDGGLEPSLPPQPFDQPALSITSPISAAESPDYIPTLEDALELGTAETYRIDLAEAGHFSFTDAALYFPPLPSVLGTVGRQEGLRQTAEATTTFLDAVLRDEANDLPRTLSNYGNLTVYK